MKKSAKVVRTPVSPWLLAVFALPFAAVGVGMLLFSVLPTLYDWGRMQTWHPVQAQLVSAQLTTQRSRKTTSFRIAAHYTYRVAGQVHEGHRVSVARYGDNIGDFQQQLGARLENIAASGQPIQVWVHPGDPAQAVIDRSLRPGLLAFKLLFVVLFGGVGLGLLWLAWRCHRDPAGMAAWFHGGRMRRRR